MTGRRSVVRSSGAIPPDRRLPAGRAYRPDIARIPTGREPRPRSPSARWPLLSWDARSATGWPVHQHGERLCRCGSEAHTNLTTARRVSISRLREASRERIEREKVSRGPFSPLTRLVRAVDQPQRWPRTTPQRCDSRPSLALGRAYRPDIARISTGREPEPRSLSAPWPRLSRDARSATGWPVHPHGAHLCGCKSEPRPLSTCPARQPRR